MLSPKSLFIKVVVIWVSFPIQLELPNLDICRGNYGQNIKPMQRWKVASLGLEFASFGFLLAFLHSNGLQCCFKYEISLEWPIKHASNIKVQK